MTDTTSPAAPLLCSTVIPTIGRSTLARSVESALAQGIEGHEVIVVNDGGTPLEPQEWMQDKKVRVIDTNRSNVTFVCNVGAAAARGRYVNFLHDDDYLLPGGLCALVDAARSSGCRWAIGSAQVVDEEGQPLTEVDSSGATGNLLAELLVGECPHMSYCLVEREAFMEAGGFDPIMRIYEDRDLCWRLALRWDVHSTPARVACVRVSGSPGSAFDFRTIGTYSRMIRDRILSSPSALRRLQDSVRRSVILRGRACRHCLFAGALNLKGGQVWAALSRLTWLVRLAGAYVILPAFWKGLLLRTRRSSDVPA